MSCRVVKNQETIGNFQEGANVHKQAVDKYNVDPSEYNKNEMVNSHNKMIEAFDEIKIKY